MQKFLENKYKYIIGILLIGCGILSIIIPPFQSPDEHAHIKRAYLMSKAVIVLDRPEGKSSGGYVDSGLLKFMESYEVVKGKLSAEEVSEAGLIKWSGRKIYTIAPGTGYYFPVIYFPQALALKMGELFDLTVDHSYRLARAFALVAIALLLYAAFRLYPPNPLIFALIATPMTLFQMSSASLDGVSTALAIFSISAFLNIAKNKAESTVRIQYVFALAIALLASSRIHALPSLVLLAAAFFYTRNRHLLFLLITVSLFVFGWTLFAIKATVYLDGPIRESTSDIIIYYLNNPLGFIQVIWQTLLDDALRDFYWKSYLGILGWLDTPFENWYYTAFGLTLSVVVLLTISFGDIRTDWSQRLLLLFVSIISVLFIFFALLVTWSPHPAQLIFGIQGRYFLIPSIFLAYGIVGNAGLESRFRRIAVAFILLFFFVFSLFSTVNLLINRYYLVENVLESEIVMIGHDESENKSKMMASPILIENRSIALKFPSLDEDGTGKINKIGIMFGTHGKSNAGDAELLLTAKGGVVYRHIFPLDELVDNSYKYFKVPAEYYISAEVRFVSGGGVSIWEIHSFDHQILSCLRLKTIRNQTVSIKGCS
jgi:uncharacterized membrane protein